MISALHGHAPGTTPPFTPRRSRRTLRRAAGKIILVCLLAGASFASAAAETAPPAFNPEHWQNDYASLKQQMERQYAHLAWFGAPESGLNLPELDQATRRVLAAARSDSEARAALLAFVRAFHDGHFRQKPVVAPARTDSVEPPRPSIAHMDGVAACAAIGAASTGKVPFSLPFETMPGFTLVSDGVAQVFRSGVLDAGAGARIGVVRIPKFVMSEYPALCLETWAKLKTATAPPSAAALEEAVADGWLKALADQLRALGTRQLHAMLVDVGGNGGGGDTGDSSVRLFSPRPVHSARLWMAAAPPLADAYFDEQLDGLRAGLKLLPADADADVDAHALRARLQQALAQFEARKAASKSRLCDLSWVWREQRPWSALACTGLAEAGFASGALDYLAPVAPGHAAAAASLYWPAVADPYRGAWAGPVYVLTDGAVGSAAEMFVATIRDNGIAKTIGAPTLGLGCGNMQKPRLIVLPHSGLRFQTPDCVRLRADGSDEVAGIRPDLPVLQSAGESERARAARVIRVIEADLAGGKAATSAPGAAGRAAPGSAPAPG